MTHQDNQLIPDPVERLGDALRQRLGVAWIPSMDVGAPAVILTNYRVGRWIGADPDPATNRITLQAGWTDERPFTPTGFYTADPAGHRDLGHWLSCGDLSDAVGVMAQALRQLLTQL